MRIKRIEADNIVDAMRELRRELGDHALILHTRQLAPKGVTGWFKSARIEILGAVDEPGVFAGGRAAASEPTPTLAPLPSAAARAALNAEGVSTFARMQQQAAARTSEPRRSVTGT
ncbi:MAG: hypothetical protein HY614_05005, partial [Candidatus Rokubacteria bacterium]|nr:hypothetical protein [Candidatus Rokubacteria bacterium]